jgi:hypothetical protein
VQNTPQVSTDTRRSHKHAVGLHSSKSADAVNYTLMTSKNVCHCFACIANCKPSENNRTFIRLMSDFRQLLNSFTARHSASIATNTVMIVLSSKPLYTLLAHAARPSQPRAAGRRGSRGNKLQQGLQARVSLIRES